MSTLRHAVLLSVQDAQLNLLEAQNPWSAGLLVTLARQALECQTPESLIQAIALLLTALERATLNPDELRS